MWNSLRLKLYSFSLMNLKNQIYWCAYNQIYVKVHISELRETYPLVEPAQFGDIEQVCLACPALHSRLEVHLHHCMCQHLVPFCRWVASRCVSVPELFTHSPGELFLVVSSLELLQMKLMSECVFTSLGRLSRTRTAGSYGGSICLTFKKLIFQIHCAVFAVPTSRVWEFWLCHVLVSTWKLVVLFILAIWVDMQVASHCGFYCSSLMTTSFPHLWWGTSFHVFICHL